MAASVHLFGVFGAYLPAHRVCAFEARGLLPGLSAILAYGSAVVAADHYFLGIGRINGYRVEISAHVGPLAQIRAGRRPAGIRG